MWPKIALSSNCLHYHPKDQVQTVDPSFKFLSDSLTAMFTSVASMKEAMGGADNDDGVQVVLMEPKQNKTLIHK